MSFLGGIPTTGSYTSSLGSPVGGRGNPVKIATKNAKPAGGRSHMRCYPKSKPFAEALKGAAERKVARQRTTAVLLRDHPSRMKVIT